MYQYTTQVDGELFEVYAELQPDGDVEFVLYPVN